MNTAIYEDCVGFPRYVDMVSLHVALERVLEYNNQQYASDHTIGDLEYCPLAVQWIKIYNEE